MCYKYKNVNKTKMSIKKNKNVNKKNVNKTKMSIKLEMQKISRRLLTSKKNAEDY